MIAAGLIQDDVAAVLGISHNTVRKHYKKELRHGYADITARLAGRLIAKADAGDLKAIMFYLETRGGWMRQDRVTVANADDKPFAVSFRWADATPSLEQSVPGTTPEENDQAETAD